ncbi:MAG: RidA family protein [SAR202 cluster bacterium]|nr:RidA family protein [SAR202 cluster bacterium]
MAQVRNVVKPNKAPKPAGMYSQGVRAGGKELLFIAGQVALNANGDLVGAGDVRAQTKQVFDNIGSVLADAGASYDNIVELTSFVVGRESVAGFLEARTGFFPKLFPKGDYPPNTLLVVAGLAKPEWLVEVKAIAALG